MAKYRVMMECDIPLVDIEPSLEGVILESSQELLNSKYLDRTISCVKDVFWENTHYDWDEIPDDGIFKIIQECSRLSEDKKTLLIALPQSKFVEYKRM